MHLTSSVDWLGDAGYVELSLRSTSTVHLPSTQAFPCPSPLRPLLLTSTIKLTGGRLRLLPRRPSPAVCRWRDQGEGCLRLLRCIVRIFGNLLVGKVILVLHFYHSSHNLSFFIMCFGVVKVMEKKEVIVIAMGTASAEHREVLQQ